jgi:hypothetical protein
VRPDLYERLFGGDRQPYQRDAGSPGTTPVTLGFGGGTGGTGGNGGAGGPS